ncbi:MAG: diguanylate cyclase [Bacteroidales bacterium]|jgi:transcriptional regulator with PAS, ATPase and Fis domain|nr:diguanylate cyclase [Bacteroidales bacterium]
MEKYFEELPIAITVSDRDCNILDLNQKSVQVNSKTNDKSLIGKNLKDCHPEPARSKMLALHEKPTVNAYTIEKNGVKKLIYQTPWYENGEFAGVVELSMEIPFDMPHYVRKPKS